MKRILTQVFTAGVIACMTTNGSVHASEMASQEGSSTVLSTNLELGLLYVDKLARPTAGLIQAGPDTYAMQTSTANKGERTLGLRYAKARFDLESAYSSRLTVVLRPDALSRNDDVHTRFETDTRAGDVYRSPAEVRLLDAYQIVIRPSTGMSLGFGVWEQLADPGNAYQQILQPGLDVELPEKFSGMRLRWNRLQAPDPSNVSRRQRGVTGDLFVIQGDGDRAENSIRGNETDDDAPGAEDPHYGIAASVQWSTSDLWTLFVSGGSLTSDVPNQATGNVNNVFADLNILVRVPSVLKGLTGSLRYKQSQESFRSTPVSMDDRVQRSFSLLLSAGVVSGTSVLAGFSHGTGEWSMDAAQPGDNSEFSGYQVELGAVNTVGKDLYLQGMLVQERRTRKDPGAAEIGAFDDGSGRKTLIRRLGIQLTYNMSGLN